MMRDQQETCKKIRTFDSVSAANWLLENYKFETGKAGEAYILMQHRSWSKSDQIRLADYFLSNLPHRSNRGYSAFLSFMALPAFIQVLGRHLPEQRIDRDLMTYHLRPLLKSHPHNQKYKQLIEDFLKTIELR